MWLKEIGWPLKKPRKPRTNSVTAQEKKELELELKRQTITAQITRSSQWSGPLPSPESIEAFRAVSPDLPDKIIYEWQEEAKHRRALEEQVVKSDISDRKWARISAFLFSIVALSVAAYCASIGLEVAASIIGGSTIASVVAAMLYWRNDSPPNEE